MLKNEIECKLNELKSKDCQAVWIILKNSKVQGAEFSEIEVFLDEELINLKIQEKTYKFCDILNIMEIY